MLVNYRGSTGYGRAWRDALTGNPGLTELPDIAAVLDKVLADGIADPTRVVLSGNSWGGYLTLLGLGLQADRWSLGVAGVPVADYIAAYEDEMDPLKAFDRALFGASPEEDPQLYLDRSPLTFIDNVRVPVMILAGANDPRCPIRHDRHLMLAVIGQAYFMFIGAFAQLNLIAYGMQEMGLAEAQSGYLFLAAALLIAADICRAGIPARRASRLRLRLASR